jgi:hypothetical protein
VDEATPQKTSPPVRLLAAASTVPLVLLALLIGVVGGAMTENGPSDTVLGIQGTLVFIAALSFLGGAGVAMAHAITGSRGSLRALAVLTGFSVLLGIAAILGYGTWCADCRAN